MCNIYITYIMYIPICTHIVYNAFKHGVPTHKIFKIQLVLNLNYSRDNNVSLINEPRVRTRQGGRFDLQPTVLWKILFRIKRQSYKTIYGFTCILMGAFMQLTC